MSASYKIERTMRSVLLLLAFAPVAFAFPPPERIDDVQVSRPCDEIDTAQVRRLTELQGAAFDVAFSDPYVLCEDLILNLDQEVTFDPNAEPNSVRFYGERNESEFFDFTVSRYAAFSDWSEYGLDEETLQNLADGQVTAAFIVGRMYDHLEYGALTFSMTNPTDGQRYHGFMLLNAVPTTSLFDINCLGGDPDGYRRCREIANRNWHNCLGKAWDDAMACGLGDGAVGVGLGGFWGCVYKAYQSGGALTGPAGWKAIAIGCAVGALIGFMVALVKCAIHYFNDKGKCNRDYQTDLDNCRTQYCPMGGGPPPTAPPAPNDPPAPPGDPRPWLQLRPTP